MKKLIEILRIFFQMGITAFGGPAAHIAMMHRRFVEEKKWIEEKDFLDLMGITSLIPGPNSTEMTMHLGYHRGGIKGLLVAGGAFIVPAALITLFLAWLYGYSGEVPQLEAFLAGIKPAVLPIIAGAVVKLGKKAVTSVDLAVLAVVSAALVLAGVGTTLVLFMASIIGALYVWGRDKMSRTTLSLLPAGQIFFPFLKIGAILYGSGYVLFAFLQDELVHRGILSQAQLLDAVAIGQFTPGPVLTTATFIGYQLGSWSGAFWATLGIFLPSFLLVILLSTILKPNRRNAVVQAFLKGVNAAALGLMAATLAEMSLATLQWTPGIFITLIASVFVFGPPKIRLSSPWIILGGSILGWALSNFPFY